MQTVSAVVRDRDVSPLNPLFCEGAETMILATHQLAPLLAHLAASTDAMLARTPHLIPPRPEELSPDVRAERAAWDKVLDLVRRAFSDALLCGGAIRNHWLGLPTEDYDVFAPFAGTMAEAIEAWQRAFPKNFAGMSYLDSASYRIAWEGHPTSIHAPKRAELIGVMRLTNLPNVPKPVEVVLVKGRTQANVLDDVRAGVLPLNFGAYDGRNMLLTNALQQDMARQEISVLPERLPDDPLAALPWIRRVIALQKLTGWPVRYR